MGKKGDWGGGSRRQEGVLTKKLRGVVVLETSRPNGNVNLLQSGENSYRLCQKWGRKIYFGIGVGG